MQAKITAYLTTGRCVCIGKVIRISFDLPIVNWRRYAKRTLRRCNIVVDLDAWEEVRPDVYQTTAEAK